MKRAQRNRRIRIAAIITLAVFFVLWVASFTTTVARFDSHSIFIFAQGKFTLITSENVLVEHRGQDIHQAFVEVADGLVDRKTASGWYFIDNYDMDLPLPVWDFAVVDGSRLFEWDFWRGRDYGIGPYCHESIIEWIPIGVPVWNPPSIRKEVYRIPTGTLLLIASIIFSLAFWRTRSFPSGHCQQCNYDLYKNTSHTCPECGTAIAAD